MKIKFCCYNPDCGHSDTDQYTIEISQENWMDSQNIAEMFCKDCGAVLKQCSEGECARPELCA